MMRRQIRLVIVVGSLTGSADAQLRLLIYSDVSASIRAHAFSLISVSSGFAIQPARGLR